MILALIQSFWSFIVGDKDGRSSILTFLLTMLFSTGSYIASNYDKILAAMLSLAGLMFLLWRWRKAAKSQLCDAVNCPHRHDPTESQ